MEAPAPVRRSVPRALRRAWLAGLVLLIVGVVLPGTLLSVPGLVVLAAAAGVTAARDDTPRGWYALAVAVPALPLVVVAGVIAWMAVQGADLLVAALLVVYGGPVLVGFWAVFAIAAVVELVRGRRRRFGAAGPAWENDATPPSYS
ncbi:hypothetical protein IEZ26_13150 [Nocardioides cavernae]|uniref:MFS transporter permease n=1 Tax=Nocardioides cavernae TaxID=1921566 RepID=A0ABR8ND57_9ACTN|nr:hypothetical protein [Nocardioides cavernae]MBD3925576.1 hypothetical protein [Nocardioides cavernae]MBM7514044.1 membrane protein implicated in regulation of membrane protease activity [Nocardioides cavernae]